MYLLHGLAQCMACVTLHSLTGCGSRVNMPLCLQVLKLNSQIQTIAETLKDEASLLVFGRGRNYATALETALKVSVGWLKHKILLLLLMYLTAADSLPLAAVNTVRCIAVSFVCESSARLRPCKDLFNETSGDATFAQVKEVALMHSEGILAGEMKHGPLALVDECMPVLVIATRDSMYAKMQAVIQQLQARGARLVILCNLHDPHIEPLAGPDCHLIQVHATTMLVELCVM